MPKSLAAGRNHQAVWENSGLHKELLETGGTRLQDVMIINMNRKKERNAFDYFSSQV